MTTVQASLFPFLKTTLWDGRRSRGGQAGATAHVEPAARQEPEENPARKPASPPFAERAARQGPGRCPSARPSERAPTPPAGPAPVPVGVPDARRRTRGPGPRWRLDHARLRVPARAGLPHRHGREEHGCRAPRQAAGRQLQRLPERHAGRPAPPAQALMGADGAPRGTRFRRPAPSGGSPAS